MALTGTITATGQTPLTDGDQGVTSALTVELVFASTGTVAVQGRVRGASTFRDLQMVPFGSLTPVLTATASGAWRVCATGCDMAQLNTTAAGGNITYAVSPTQG